MADLQLIRPSPIAPESVPPEPPAPYTQEPPPPGRLVATFYSYKGGVGRSQALLSTGHLLAWRRRTVLLVDVDLEAPGLTLALLDDEQRASRDGFLEIASDLANVILHAAAGNRPLPSELVAAFADRILASLHQLESSPPEGDLVQELQTTFPDSQFGRRQPALCLLSSGRVYDDYAEAMKRLRLPELYAAAVNAETVDWLTPVLPSLGVEAGSKIAHQTAGEVFVDVLRHALSTVSSPTGEKFQYILIDSRAGLADVGGLCVRGLADHLVILSGLNEQNLQGTRMVTDALPDHLRKPHAVTFVLSPIPEGEVDLLAARLDRASELLDLPSKPIRLHYHPHLALLETPLVSGRHQAARLAGDYRRLCGRVQAVNRDESAQWIARAQRLMLGGELPLERLPDLFDCLMEIATTRADLAAAILQPIVAALGAADSAQAATRDAARLLTVLQPESLPAWGVLGQQLRGLATQAWDDADQSLARAICEEAGTALRRALDLEDDPLRTLGHLVDFHRKWAQREWNVGDLQLARAHFGQSLAACEQAVRQDPDAHALLSLWAVVLDDLALREREAGNTQAAREKLREAIGHCEHAADMGPDAWSVHTNWGLVLAHMAELEWDAGNTDIGRAHFRDAFRQYGEAAELKQNEYRVLVNWGLLSGMCTPTLPAAQAIRPP